MSNTQIAMTPERVLMETIDECGIQLSGATPAMLVSVLRTAGFITEPRSSASVDTALASLGYTLEHAEHPNQVGQWAPDESKAYRDYDGFQPGRDAVQAVRRAKLGGALNVDLAGAQASVLRRAARELEDKSAAYAETSEGMIDNDDYGTDDIIRYGAYASGASATAHTLRKQAEELAGLCPACTDGKVFSEAEKTFEHCSTCG